MAHFQNGENPLAGVPKRHIDYNICYVYPAKPTAENIDSILSWKQAEKLSIFDYGDVTISLTKRSTELGGLSRLSQLSLYVQNTTYKEVNVGAFIENLPSLYQIEFRCNSMSLEQMEDFRARNTIPSTWQAQTLSQSIRYRNMLD